MISGLGPVTYWLINFAFDFMFYMGTALIVLLPLPFVPYTTLAAEDFPGTGPTFLIVSQYASRSPYAVMSPAAVIAAAGDTTDTLLTTVIEVTLQVLRLLPNQSYSRGMTKIIQLAREKGICRKGGLQLESRCHTRQAQGRLSLLQCCLHLDAPDPSEYAIKPLDVSPYSVFYEFITLTIEGPVLFALLVCIEIWLPSVDMALSSLDQNVYKEGAVPAPAPSPAVGKALAGSKKGLSFTVRTGECFGLLGVNGVGKTTTFRVLTGDILPHFGDAKVSGFSIVHQTWHCQRYLGYCPQRDGLLDMLTGTETLLLFGRLRGLNITPQYLNVLAHIFRLEEIVDHLVVTYSVGNRRKLSICVSMMGMPRMLLLDEPYNTIATTARKRIVNYISELQRVSKMSILLSSHSLSDVEFLCNRIAIMGEGRLQCLGSLTHLKEKFGKGYTIGVKTYPDKKQDFVYQKEVADAVCNTFPETEMVHSVQGLLEFRMSHVEMPWSEMFTRMAKIKKRFKLQDFFISDTSLEQIYTSVTRKEAFEAAAAAAAATAAPATGALPPGLGTSLGI
ncbi:hypothetical protein HPB51_001248 [Rhipicephalus microplus]|uniref:ABC transporter domain-containing protein n=1 Tax=Rhipicephalus microplus TaxID=6941 RepID=A0A9J6E4N7_RHIMP|nr:hypothetical protein HPB51_001248 [Rhipicephalus microplus]